MESRTKFALYSTLAVVLLLVLFYFSSEITNVTGKAVLSEENLKDFVACLNTTGVRIFVDPSQESYKMQMSIFGDAYSGLNIVDCTLEKEKCVGVIIYPTWQIHDIIIHGSLTLDALRQFSRC